MSTMRDISKKSGYSLSTVSKVLSNDKNFNVTNKTRNIILETAKELNYTYTTRKKLYNIGLIMPKSFEAYTDPFFTVVLSSIEKESKSLGMNITMILMGSTLSNNISLYDRDLSALDGLIIMDELTNEIMTYLGTLIKHIITIDFFTPKYTSVGFNHFLSNLAMMEHLINCGYKKIAYIGGSTERFKIEEQIQFMMYRESLINNNLEFNPNFVKDCKWDISLCAKEVKSLLKNNEKPDAIFMASDNLAAVALGIVNTLNLNCPEDIGIAGFNDIETSKHFVPSLTTVNIPIKDIGIIAANQLIKQMKYDENQIIEINVPFKLKSRNSTKKII